MKLEGESTVASGLDSTCLSIIGAATRHLILIPLTARPSIKSDRIWEEN